MPNLQIDVVPVTPWQQNCMVVSRAAEGACLVVDPGGDLERVVEAIGVRRVEGILVTHGHIDHIGALDLLVAETQAPVWYHAGDLFLYESGMGPRSRKIALPTNAVRVDDGDRIEVAGIGFEVLHTPGHSPGSVSFFHEGVVFSGDVLFAGSIGRTDLPRASFDELVESIESKLWPLPDDTRVLPGHGPPTTIGMEKQHNPFVGVHAAGPGRR